MLRSASITTLFLRSCRNSASWCVATDDAPTLRPERGVHPAREESAATPHADAPPTVLWPSHADAHDCAKLQPPSKVIPELESLLSQMDADGVAPDSFTHAIMVGAYGNNGDFAAAQAYVARSGATEDLVISNALMRAAVRDDNAQLALSILELLEEDGPVFHRMPTHAAAAAAHHATVPNRCRCQ